MVKYGLMPTSQHRSTLPATLADPQFQATLVFVLVGLVVGAMALCVLCWSWLNRGYKLKA